MSEPRPFASLSPSLLARKGAARPAMRPQLQPLRQFQEAALRQPDDLGWNDMGYDIDPPAPAPVPQHAEPVVAGQPSRTADVVAIAAQAAAPVEAATPAEVAKVPEVVRGQQDLAAHVEASAADEAAVADTAEADTVAAAASKVAARLTPPRRRRSAAGEGRRAAFTLRLDSDRHLRLRLACTVGNRSAQQLVTEALDRLLSAMPEIDGLARQVRQGQ